MDPNPDRPEDTEPVARFKPTNGLAVGVAGLVGVAVALGYVAWSVHTLTGLRLALGLGLFGVVVWVTQLRPRATAYRHHLELRNALVDVRVPLACIDEVSMGQTLAVRVGTRRYVCIGIGRSVRAELKERRRRQRSPLGSSRLHEFARKAEMAAPEQTAMAYPTFVVTRIEELVEQARREQPPGAEPGEVRRSVALPEAAALAVLAVAFVVSLLL